METMRHQRVPVKMANIQNTDNSKCWQECGARGIIVRGRWECKVVQLLSKTAWQFLTKLNILLPYDLAIALLGIYPNELKTYAHTETCTLFIAL